MAIALPNDKSMNGRRLEALREQAGLSRAQLATNASVTESQIWRIEKGVRGCSADALRRIADVLATRLRRRAGTLMEELTDPDE